MKAKVDVLFLADEEKSERRVPCRSPQMEDVIVKEVTRLLDDFNAGTGRFEGRPGFADTF